MRAFLSGRDRTILIASGLLLLAVAAASVLVPPAAGPGVDFPCSYATGAGGAKVAYLLLKDLGYAVARLEGPAGDIPVEGAGAVLIAPEPFAVTEGWRARVHQFVRAGGRVLVTGMSGASLLPGGARMAGDFLDVEPRSYPALLPSPLTRGASIVTMAPGPSWEEGTGEVVPLYGENGRMVAVTLAEGRGRIIWWSAATPITNVGISQAANLALLLNIVGPVRDTLILWDEASHAHGGSLLAYLERTPLTSGLFQAGLVFLAVCLTFSRRSGPLRAGGEPARHSPLEFVDSMGELYRRAGAASSAVGIFLARFRGLLTRRLGLAPATPAGPLAAAAAARLGCDASRLEDLLRETEWAASDPATARADGLRLARRLQDESRRLETGVGIPGGS